VVAAKLNQLQFLLGEAGSAAATFAEVGEVGRWLDLKSYSVIVFFFGFALVSVFGVCLFFFNRYILVVFCYGAELTCFQNLSMSQDFCMPVRFFFSFSFISETDSKFLLLTLVF